MMTVGGAGSSQRSSRLWPSMRASECRAARRRAIRARPNGPGRRLTTASDDRTSSPSRRGVRDLRLVVNDQARNLSSGTTDSNSRSVSGGSNGGRRPTAARGDGGRRRRRPSGPSGVAPNASCPGRYAGTVGTRCAWSAATDRRARRPDVAIPSVSVLIGASTSCSSRHARDSPASRPVALKGSRSRKPSSINGNVRPNSVYVRPDRPAAGPF